MRKLFLVLAAALGLSVAGGALADQIDVTYGLVPSATGTPAANTSHFDSISPTPITNLAPINGTVEIVFTGDGAGNIANGAVTIKSIVANTDLGAAGFGGAALGLSGVVTSALSAPVTSTATAGTITAVAGTLHISGTVNCSGTCTFLGVPASTTLNTDVTVMLGGTGTTGNPATFSSTQPLSIVLGSLTSTGTAVLFGNETGRTVTGGVIPEPGTLLLLSAGLTGLGLIGRRRS